MDKKNSVKKIAVITYDTPTRKTQEVLLRIRAKGYQKVEVIAIPFIPRKSLAPLVIHRPTELLVDLDNEQLAKNLGYSYIKNSVENLSQFFHSQNYHSILIAGAGLLPSNLVKEHKLINSHPGYLPYVRGLDAVKWAIYNKLPLGITVHFIDEETDAGLLIDQTKLDILPTDTFHSVCYSIWNLEMKMLVDSIELIDNLKEFQKLATNLGEPTRRMPKEKEEKLYIKFEEYKKEVLK